MVVSGQTACSGHFTAREKARVGGWVSAGAGLDVFERRKFCCLCQDLRPSCPVYILVNVLTVLLHTDLKIIKCPY